MDVFNIIRESVYKNYYILQKMLPYKNGYLSGQSLPAGLNIKDTPDGWKISINLINTPYAEYIDRPGYKTNGYWDKVCKKFLAAVATDLNGKLSKGGNE